MKKIVFLLILVLFQCCKTSSIEKDAMERFNYVITEEYPKNNGVELKIHNKEVVYHSLNDSLVIIRFVGETFGETDTLRYIYYLYKDGPYESISERDIENPHQWESFTVTSDNEDAKKKFIDSAIKSSCSLIITSGGRKVE